MKQIMKWIAAIVLTPILLFLLLTVLLYLPPVQNWVVKKVVSYASEQTGMYISVDNVRLSFPLDLEINGFKMIKPTVPPDTVADVRQLVADVSLLPLLKGEVEVNALELNEAKVNTTDFIPSARIKGYVGKLYLQSHGINLGAETVKVNDARLERSQLDIALCDTVPEDTTESEANWKIDISDLVVKKTAFTLHMPGDTMAVHAQMDYTLAEDAHLGLKDAIYQVGKLRWQGGQVDYDVWTADEIRKGKNHRDYRQPHHTQAFDASHLRFTDLHLSVDSFIFASPRMAMNIRSAQFQEQGGLEVDALTSHFSMDDKRLSLPDMKMKTPHTDLAAHFQMDMNTFDDVNPGKLFADVDGYVGKHDIQVFAPTLPKKMMQKWPNRPLALKGHAEGNLQYLSFRDFHASLPTAFDLTATGWVANPSDAERLRADVNIKGRTDNLDFITAMLPPETQKQIRIPRGIGLNGNVKANGPLYSTDMTVTEGGGTAHVKGMFDTRTEAYHVTAAATRLHLEHFVPDLGFSPFTGTITAEGRGTDFLNPRSGAKIHADIKEFRYGNYDLSGLGGDISLQGGMLHAKVTSGNSMLGGHFNVDGVLTDHRIDLHVKGHVKYADLKRLGIMDQHYVVSASDADLYIKSDMKQTHSVHGRVGDFSLSERQANGELASLVAGDFTIDGKMSGRLLTAHFDGMISRADLYRLGVTEHPVSTSFGANLTLRSDLKDYYDVQGNICNFGVQAQERFYSVGDADVDILTRRDTVHAVVNSGDFYLNADASGGHERLLKQIDRFTNTVQLQLKNKTIDQKALREQLPEARLRLRSGGDNLFTYLLSHQGYTFRSANIDLTSSSTEGINGTARFGSLKLLEDSITVDSVDLALTHDAERLNYALQILNNPTNTYPYKGTLKGFLHEKGLSAHATVVDKDNQTGLDLGLMAQMEQGGMRFNITSPRSVLGYKEFAVNDDNYLFLGNEMRLSANMKLKADDGTGAFLYTNDSNTEALQDMTLTINQLELGKIFQVLPFAPSVSGVLDGDFHLIQTRDDLTISSDMTIGNLVYEHSPMGNVGVQLVYMPKGDGSHYVDAIISQDGNEVGMLTGTYQSEGEGYLDARFVLNKFPLHYVNGFVPDQIIGLRGTGEGELTVVGPLNKLDINGEVYLDSSYVYSLPYGVEMRFANDPVRVQHSKILFENFEVFANNDSPLNIQGSFDFSNMDRMMLDVRMRAQNFLLIDAKENPRSEAYGKAYVNFFGMMRGPLDGLTMRGKLDVLGNTDMTYVLKESALATDNQLDELVKFVDFSDSTSTATINRPEIAGLNMNLNISIDEQAHIVCALNADHSNYIDLIGGGNLRMSYDPNNDLRLTGRYTLSQGEMKYALPVIPLRTFNIQQGSYIEFTGEPMNPTLNITATERLKSSVSSEGEGDGRMVDFDCGVKMTSTLSKPTIEFIINAPEDMQMQSELNTKSMEERGKLAVSMLASGMYLGDGSGTTNAAMSGALAAFMQNEINNITGSALRSMGLDLSANLATSTDATGGLHTDYTFKFSKHLMNNRLRIIMGGRVSTGNSAYMRNGAFFDNFSMEYRLNKNETQYLKLFYQRDSYDWLEGELSEYGAGFLWRRKLDRFWDIFNFKTKTPQLTPPKPKRDTLVNFTAPVKRVNEGAGERSEHKSDGTKKE